jgi:2-polyprenyl-3-methyl-5-hydroxy-6-metoxy-1,4-benzoquinol methylase
MNSMGDMINPPIQNNCILCHSQGRQLYRSLSDRLFHSTGKWSFLICPNIRCGLIWLVPKPTPEDMGSLYFNYYTHANQAGQSHALAQFYNVARQGYLQIKYAYPQGVGPKWYRLLSFMAYVHPLGIRHAQASAMFLESPESNNRLLDVGCGNGDMFDKMKILGWDVEGIETDPVACKLANAKHKKIYISELEGREYADDHFDAIILNHVLEHVNDPIRLIKECHRILKPDGRMIIVTPNALGFGHRHFKESWRGLEPPRHLYIFSTRNICKIAEA